MANIDFYSIKISDKNAIETVERIKNNEKGIVIPQLNWYEEELKNENMKLLFVLLGGYQVSWDLGLIGVAKAVRVFDRGYDDKNPKNFKLEIDMLVTLDEVITRDYFIPYVETYNSGNGIGVATKGVPNQAICGIEEKQGVAVLRAMIDKYPHMMEMLVNVLPFEIIEKIKAKAKMLLPCDVAFGEFSKLGTHAIDKSENNIVGEDDFKEWFKKQVKKDGTPYSIRSYDNYIAAFRYAFKKLEGKLEGYTSLFDVKDIATFDIVEKIIVEDELYESELKVYSHNSLPAGLAKYRQYLLDKQGVKRVHYGTNRIFYGVPGSGKSYTIEQEVKDCYTKRVVFHPDYTYFDFVGQILPKAVNGKVQYDFTVGPFTEILEYAVKNPEAKCVLIIEELNRGNAPAIFGELFQLLDRCEDEINLGESRYGITNHEIAEAVYGDKDAVVKLPCNLSIFATMNTSDQNVFTLDTAFQRRWWMKYIPNKFSKDQERKEIIGSKICWGAFAVTVNNIMHESNDGIGSTEDKSLGAYFAQNKDFEKDRFSEKVIKYLWDDAFKMDREAVFSDEYVSFEQIISAYQDENAKDCLKEILREDVYERMLQKNKEILKQEETITVSPEQIEMDLV